MIAIKLKDGMEAYKRRTRESITYADVAEMSGLAVATIETMGSKLRLQCHAQYHRQNLHRPRHDAGRASGTDSRPTGGGDFKGEKEEKDDEEKKEEDHEEKEEIVILCMPFARFLTI